MITSNATCLATSTATSNILTMTVNPNLTPSVTIEFDRASSCIGSTVYAFANAVNCGASPRYFLTPAPNQDPNGPGGWDPNGDYSSRILTLTGFSNLTKVSCKVIVDKSSGCYTALSAVSNMLTLNVTPNLHPSVSISAGDTEVCEGTTVNFIADPMNGGASPTYQWKRNDINISGATDRVYTTILDVGPHDITCVMTPRNGCFTSGAAVTSNTLKMMVGQKVTPEITISADPGYYRLLRNISNLYHDGH